MNSRYLTNAALILAGAFLVVASQAFGASIFEWIMLGIGVVAMLAAGAVLERSRGRVQRSLDATIGVLGAWTIVASQVFAGSTMTWLGFASGIALFALALLGLTLHELSTERVVHSIEVRTAVDDHDRNRELAGVS